MSSCLNYVLLLIPILINVAFITLLERKILGYSQLRKGPNKVSLVGLAQPFNDAVKLFSKEIVFPQLSNTFQFFISPLGALVIVLITGWLIPLKESLFPSSFSVLFLYMMLSMNIYPVLVSGWASNSKYALIGSLRAVAQTVSYEVSLAVILLFFLMLSESLNLMLLMNMNFLWNKIILFVPMAGIWLISCMAETNRTPFDFAEGESELVSGFNIEYGSLGFALIFMAEYASIFLMSMLFSFLFLSDSFLCISVYVFSSLIVSVWVWVRTTFPRYRYDKLMNLAWKVYLPLVLCVLSYGIFLGTS